MKKGIGTILLVQAGVIMLLHQFFVELVKSYQIQVGLVDNAIMLSTIFGFALIVESETNSDFRKEIADFFKVVFEEG